MQQDNKADSGWMMREKRQIVQFPLFDVSSIDNYTRPIYSKFAAGLCRRLMRCYMYVASCTKLGD